MRIKKLNSRGDALIVAMIAVAVIALLIMVIPQMVQTTTDQNVRARTKAIMAAVEQKLREVAHHPLTYTCTKNAGFGCTLNSQVVNTFQGPIIQTPGACDNRPNCGIVVSNMKFEAANGGVFSADIKLMNATFTLENIKVSEQVNADSMNQNPDCTAVSTYSPILMGLDAQTGVPICRGVNPTCAPNQYIESIDPVTMSPTCADLPVGNINCGSDQQMLTTFYWQGGTKYTYSCSPRVNPYIAPWWPNGAGSVGCNPPRVLVNGVCQIQCLPPQILLNGTCQLCPSPNIVQNGSCVCLAPNTLVDQVCTPCLAPNTIVDGVCVSPNRGYILVGWGKNGYQMLSASGVNASGASMGPSNMSFTIPANVKTLKIIAAGGGGSGGSGNGYPGDPFGGGAGNVLTATLSSPAAKGVISFTIGTGGAPVAVSSKLPGNRGQATTVNYPGGSLRAQGGDGGWVAGGNAEGSPCTKLVNTTTVMTPKKRWGTGGTPGTGGPGGDGVGLCAGGGGVDHVHGYYAESGNGAPGFVYIEWK
ncbi:MAG: hypothetical protein RJB66_1969 [Pseudomonadota bacterium]|jgi:hypothetical protein